MIDIFIYSDFRTYLQHYYEEKKRCNIHFSFQYLAQKADFKNRCYLFNIIYGKKYLSQSNRLKLSKALHHSKVEAEYFECIVNSIQAKQSEVRDYYHQKAQQIRISINAKTQLLCKAQEEFYTKWYHSAIRALIDQYPFDGNYEKLGQQLVPPITGNQARRSIRLLARLGLIMKKNDGSFYISGKRIKAGHEISPQVKERFHLTCIELARKQILSQTPAAHMLSSITLGISQKTYETIRRETKQFKDRIKELAENDQHADRVYQYQLICYPLTINPIEQSKGRES